MIENFFVQDLVKDLLDLVLYNLFDQNVLVEATYLVFKSKADFVDDKGYILNVVQIDINWEMDVEVEVN